MKGREEMKKILSILIGISLIISMNNIGFAVKEEKEIGIDELMKFTLEKAIEFAMENSREIKIQTLELERAKRQHEEYDGYLWRGTDEYKEEYYKALSLPPTHQNSSINKALKDNGAKKKNIQLELNMAKWNTKIIENKIRYDVEKAYYDLLQYKEELDIAEESLKLATDEYDQSKTKYELGNISQQQLLTGEMALYEAQSGHDEALIEYELQKMSFNNTLGLPLMQNIELADKIEFKLYQYIDFESKVEEAQENSAALQVAAAKKEIARLVLRAIETTSHNTGVYKREAEVALERADNNLESAKNAVEISVRSSGMILMNTGKQIKNYTTAVKSAEKSYELAKLNFELGQNTLNDVNQARINLMNAKKNLSKQIHRYNLAHLDYKYSTGVGKDILG